MEDHIPELPEGRRPYPRRNGPYVSEAVPDPAAAARLDASVRAEDDPARAAVAAMAAHGNGTRDCPDWLPDAWTAERGVAFAACAVAELSGYQYRWETGGTFVPVKPLQDDSLYVLGGAGVQRMRELLAAAGEEEYAAAERRLEGHRRTRGQRFVAAFLVPTRTDWVDECCAHPPLYNNHVMTEQYELLLCSLSTPHQVGLLRPLPWPRYTVLTERLADTLVDGLGAEALPLLLDLLENQIAESRRQVLRALATLPSDAAFQCLVDRVGDKEAPPALLRAMEAFPRRALRLLPPAAAGSTKAAGVAADLLRRHLRGHRDLAAEVVPGLPDGARKVAERTLAEIDDAASEAPAAALPAVLASPPWAVKRKRAKAVVIRGLEPPAPVAVWEPGEREGWAPIRSNGYWYISDRGQDPEEMARKFGSLDPFRQGKTLATVSEEVARPRLASWVPRYLYPWDIWERALLARFELDALHVVGLLGKSHPDFAAELALPFLDTGLVELVARCLMRVRRARRAAVAWFARHGLAAVPYLVPAALGKPGAVRRDAEGALRHLAAEHGAGPVVAAVRPYGQQAADAVAGMLATDPLEVLPASFPKPAAWSDPRTLPRIRLKDGRALSAEATGHVLTMLSISKPDQVYPGVPIVRDACDPGSLAAFSWELFRGWDLHGAPTAAGWGFQQLAWLGDDSTVRRLAPLIRSWPGEGRKQTAATALGLLAGIGTETALAHLYGIGQKARSDSLKKRAMEWVDEVAADLGLSRGQLADRLVPALGLDADGSMTLDYGPRRFTVGFDEQLKPYVRDEDGRARKSLPRPGAGDDPGLAPAAHRRFAELRKDVAKVAEDQVRRLEEAMVRGRRWPEPEFRKLIVDHPLLWHIARRLVWVDDAGTAFRIAEDRTLADSSDEPFTLPASARVGIAHPVGLGEKGVAAWSEVFADYEILQPFPQLGRPVHEPTERERGASSLERFEGLKAAGGPVMGLRQRTWHDGPADDGLAREVAEGVHAVVRLFPGFGYGGARDGEEQEIQRVHLTEGTWGDLDPVIVSEVIADLTTLTWRRP
ncbi:DUF4132 domain-containing protein [Actinomadura rugatobispora]|uniref:DUF4132 domain-containing protein n=1 Tax=Actinomadura rugatobispora TaxID=1994 RepID=A0ABW1A4M1_9ACTN|nr:hypothetical protein GCM10010200_018110 [Actinomadura rugatobispora]